MISLDAAGGLGGADGMAAGQSMIDWELSAELTGQKGHSGAVLKA